MAKKEIPVYLFTGFLEAGKTTFIQETLTDPGFNTGERTLVLLFEEGVEELDPTAYPSPNVFLETIEREEELNAVNLSSLAVKHSAERVIIEYNGMWLLDRLYAALPESWTVYQEVMFADGSTFLDYNNNMRQLMVDKLTSADPVIFNRVKPDFDKMLFHKTVRAVSRSCGILYEYTDKHIEQDEIEDPLPFDLDAPVVEIGDDDFAYFYRDISEDPMKYDGKTVRFCGLVLREDGFPKGTIAVGRQLMVCCQEDITYRAFAAETPSAKEYATGLWVRLTARVSVENHKLYQGKGPVLKTLKIERASRPERPVATF